MKKRLPFEIYNQFRACYTRATNIVDKIYKLNKSKTYSRVSESYEAWQNYKKVVKIVYLYLYDAIGMFLFGGEKSGEALRREIKTKLCILNQHYPTYCPKMYNILKICYNSKISKYPSWAERIKKK